MSANAGDAAADVHAPPSHRADAQLGEPGLWPAHPQLWEVLWEVQGPGAGPAECWRGHGVADESEAAQLGQAAERTPERTQHLATHTGRVPREWAAGPRERVVRP